MNLFSEVLNLRQSTASSMAIFVAKITKINSLKISFHLLGIFFRCANGIIARLINLIANRYLIAVKGAEFRGVY